MRLYFIAVLWYFVHYYSLQSPNKAFRVTTWPLSSPCRLSGGHQPVLLCASPGAGGLRCSLLQGLRAQWLDAVVHLLSDLLQQECGGEADADALHPGLQCWRRWDDMCECMQHVLSRLIAADPLLGTLLSNSYHLLGFKRSFFPCLPIWISPHDSGFHLMSSNVFFFFQSRLTVTAMVVAWITVMEGNTSVKVLQEPLALCLHLASHFLPLWLQMKVNSTAPVRVGSLSFTVVLTLCVWNRWILLVPGYVAS